MTIDQYFDEIKAVLDRYTATHFVIEANVNFDMRPGKQGYLNGSIYLINGSVLHFKEFLDVASEKIDKLMYSYHCQDAENKLIFRYDNAVHRPPLSFVYHRHLPEKILEDIPPTLGDVLAELFRINEWV